MTGPAPAVSRSRCSWRPRCITPSPPDVPQNPRLVFVPPDGAPLPPTLSLADSWALQAGVYVFTGAAVARLVTFTSAVRALVSSQPWTGTRLLWVTDPNAEVNDWELAGIPLTGLTSGGGQLSALTAFGFRNYGCLLNGGLALSAEAAGPRFSIAPASPGDIRLTTDSGATELPVIDGPVTIPLTGPAAGCLTFAARLAVGDGADGSIDALDVGCRFFFDDPDLAGTGLITSNRYPVFDTSTPAAGPAPRAVELAGQLDPVAPLDPGRTCLTFPARHRCARSTGRTWGRRWTWPRSPRGCSSPCGPPASSRPTRTRSTWCRTGRSRSSRRPNGRPPCCAGSAGRSTSRWSRPPR